MKSSPSTIADVEPSFREACARRPLADANDAALEALWASRPSEVRAAQRLRYRDFAEEMGARIEPTPGARERLDVAPRVAARDEALVC